MAMISFFLFGVTQMSALRIDQDLRVLRCIRSICIFKTSNQAQIPWNFAFCLRMSTRGLLFCLLGVSIFWGGIHFSSAETQEVVSCVVATAAAVIVVLPDLVATTSPE